MQLLVEVDLRTLDAPFPVALLQALCHTAGTNDAIYVNTLDRPRVAGRCVKR